MKKASLVPAIAACILLGSTAAPRALKLALVMAAGALAYFASLWAMGFRLRDFARHE